MDSKKDSVCLEMRNMEVEIVDFISKFNSRLDIIKEEVVG